MSPLLYFTKRKSSSINDFCEPSSIDLGNLYPVPMMEDGVTLVYKFDMRTLSKNEKLKST